MTGTPQDPLLLTLHAVRLLGFASTGQIAGRFGQDAADVEGLLIDAGARGWALRSSFGSSKGWSLTVAGRTENERLLGEELDSAGGRAGVTAVLAEFAPLNTQVVAACGKIQLERVAEGRRPGYGVDGPTLGMFTGAVAFLEGLEGRLTRVLPRFGGYTERLARAVADAAVDPAWLTGTDRDSFHRIWFELHEDLLATLGIPR